MTIDDYFAYGEVLATSIPIIGHTPNRPRFVKILDTQGQTDEFGSAVNNKLDSEATVLVWEMFTEQPQTAGRSSYTSLLEGSFVVMRKGKSNSDRLAVLNQCRPIALAILKQMVMDGMVGPLQERRIVPTIEGPGEGIGPMASSWYGWAYTFAWRVPLFDSV